MALHRKIVIKVDGFLESFAAKLNGANTVKYKPGEIVKLNSSGNFEKAAAADSNTRLFVLNTRDYVGDLLSEEQSGGDTASAFELIPNRTVQIRKITSGAGNAITVNGDVQISGTAGSVNAQSGTGIVIGTCVEAAPAAQELVKVRIF